MHSGNTIYLNLLCKKLRERRTSFFIQYLRHYFTEVSKFCCTVAMLLIRSFGIALRAVTIVRPETLTKKTEINISEFLTFVWLLSLKCYVCLSFVILMRKMTNSDKNCKLVSLTSFALHANFHMDLNAPCLPTKSLHNHRFQFLLDIAVVPREIDDNAYANFLGD